MWKKVGIGCGILVGLGGVAAFAAVLFLPRLIDFVERKVAEEQERQAIAAEWAAPDRDAGPAQVFPAAVGGYQLDKSDDRAAVPDLDVGARGVHAVYTAGPSRIEVFAYPVSKPEADALIRRVEQVYKHGGSGSGTRTWSKIDLGDSYARVYLTTPKLGQNHLWFTKGWLLVFRTSDSEDREPFVKSFLRGTDRPDGAADQKQ